ncbi:SH3 domain protein [Ceratocystis lukuohia]|uniref:SH3 domain protein n=1 Tax=Ceratocystis lukuohia TaxID=2019550 RepID=A0ABR4MPS4_9PEZI
MRLPLPAVLQRDILPTNYDSVQTSTTTTTSLYSLTRPTANMNSFDLRAESDSGLAVDDQSSSDVPLSIVPTSVNELAGLPSQITEIEGSLADSTGGLALAGALTTSASIATNSATASQTEASPTSSASGSDSGSDSGLTSAGVAGIVIGLLGLILVVGLGAYFFLQHKKKQAQRKRLMDEKPDFLTSMNPNGSAPIRPAPPTGPGSSLRNTSGSGPSVPLKDVAGAASASPSDSTPSSANPDSTSLRESQTETNAANPFGANAEKINILESQNPFSDGDNAQPESNQSDSKDATATTTSEATDATAASAAPALTRQASRRHDTSKLDLTLPVNKGLPGPPSPTGSDYSVNMIPDGQEAPQTEGAAAIAAAGGPAMSVVHRVKLDFTPSMKDEMELQTGQLVRLLHVYDDGWVLCIRLDRSQQGVVPRTCLSDQPVKPRASTGKPPVSMNNFVLPVPEDGRSPSPGHAY